MSGSYPQPHLAALPPGPELAALLDTLDPDTLRPDNAVTVLRAWSRQRAHDHPRLARVVARVATLTRHAGRLCGAEGEWAGAEIAAALTWSDTRAGQELLFAETLLDLPAVLAAFETGLIDHGKAWAFTDVLGCADLTSAQTDAVCAAVLPAAPGLTAGRLRHRLLRAVLAVDPQWSARRYHRALTETRVHGYLAADGTAVITATGLPAADAAAACARVDTLAARLRRAGHPATLAQIRTRVFLRLLDGSLTGLNTEQILTTLLAEATTPAPAAPTTDPDPGPGPTPAADTSAHTERADAHRADTAHPAATRHDEAPGDNAEGDVSEPDRVAAAGIAHTTAHATVTGPSDQHGGRAAPAGQPDPDRTDERASPPTSPADTHPPDCSPPANPTAIGNTRAAAASGRDGPRAVGVEIRIGLATLLGIDHRPGEIPHLGPVLPDIASALVATQLTAGWRFAILDTDGYLVLAGLLRRRPALQPPHPPGQRAGGTVEIHVTEDHLAALAAHPDDHPAWAAVIEELVHRHARRAELTAALTAHPDSRFARAALARHIQIRDRTCVAPGCHRPAVNTQLDHTRDHAHGGTTDPTNTGPLCLLHHARKHRSGWQLDQPIPGHFRWTSPLGERYLTRGEAIRPQLPDPLDQPADETSLQTRAGHPVADACADAPIFGPRPPRGGLPSSPTPPARTTRSFWRRPEAAEDPDDPAPF